MFGNDPNEKNTVHAMLEFAEDLDECRKIQFAKFVCLLTVSQVSAVEITELTKLLVSRYFPTLHSSLFCHGRRKTLAHSILAVIVTIVAVKHEDLTAIQMDDLPEIQMAIQQTKTSVESPIFLNCWIASRVAPLF